MKNRMLRLLVGILVFSTFPLGLIISIVVWVINGRFLINEAIDFIMTGKFED